MNPFLENLKRQAAENPMIALAAGATALTAVTQFVGAAVNAKNSRAWAKEVARRRIKDGLKK
jgi:hypothetical protein